MTTLAPFALHPARSVEEATGLLAELGDDAVIYAGGTELLLLMKLGFAAYGHLVDVKPIGELAGIGVVEGWLRIGGAVTHRAIERSPLIAAGWPALVSMERRVANVRVRSTGTLGGNLAFADPHSDPATFLIAAGARLVLGLGDERRTVPVAEFVRGSYETALQRTELLVAIEVPPLPGDAAMAHLRFAFHERPAATISCLARVRDGLLVETRIAVGSVGVMPVRAGDAESLLSGTLAADLPPSVLEAAGRAAAEAADPMTDANGSATYKRDLVRVLVGRCVREAVDAALLRATAA